MENKQAVVKINGHDYKIRFTIGFWKEIKEVCGITKANLDSKLKDEFGTCAAHVVSLGIKWGNNEGIIIPTLKDIESELDSSVADVIEQAIINGMTKAEKEMLDIAVKQRNAKIKEISDEIDEGSKKKLQSANTAET